METGKGFAVKFDGYVLFLPGLQAFGFGKANQPPGLLGNPCLGQRNVDFHHFLTGIAACIFHQHFQRNLPIRNCCTGQCASEGGIGQTVAKGEQGFHAKAVKIPVAYENTFPVIFLAEIAVQIAEAFGIGNVFVALRPGCGETTARGGLS